MISECQRIACRLTQNLPGSSNKVAASHLSVLQAETELLQKVGESGNLAIFAKHSKIEKYLETARASKNKISLQAHQNLTN